MKYRINHICSYGLKLSNSNGVRLPNTPPHMFACQSRWAYQNRNWGRRCSTSQHSPPNMPTEPSATRNYHDELVWYRFKINWN